MNGTQLLSRRYAQAFMHVYGKDIIESVFEKIRELVSFLLTHRKALFFLQLPHIPSDKKITILTELLVEQFKLPGSFEPLIKQLVDHKRSFLIAKILHQIAQLYMKEHNIEAFIFTSSHELTKAQLEEMKRYLADRLGKDIIYEYKIDKTLIAGIRLLSDTHIWEYSIAQQLHRVSLPLLA